MRLTIICIIAMLGSLCACQTQNSRDLSADKEATQAHPLVGAYTEGRSVSEDEMKLFRDTYKGDVELTPISVSTQVVAGTNYRFICRDKDGHSYRVTIYQKLPCYGGEAEVTDVTRL